MINARIRGQHFTEEERTYRIKTIERLRNEGLTWRQIGAQMGIAKTAVESWYTRQDRTERDPRQKRACMCCRQEFPSEGIHNRLCGRCKQERNVSPWEMVEGASRRAGRH